MELLVIIAALIAIGAWWMWKEHKHEESGSHPLDSATKAPESNTTLPPNSTEAPTLTNVLDVNQDGRVDFKDAVAAADIVVTKTKKATTKVKTKATEAVEKAKKTVKSKKSK